MKPKSSNETGMRDLIHGFELNTLMKAMREEGPKVFIFNYLFFNTNFKTLCNQQYFHHRQHLNVMTFEPQVLVNHF